jgi:hypothetical protein
VVGIERLRNDLLKIFETIKLKAATMAREVLRRGLLARLKTAAFYTPPVPGGAGRIEPCIMLPEGGLSSHLRCNPTQGKE